MITPEQARAELARRELAKRELESPKTPVLGFGGVGYGARAVQEGLSPEDLPHIVAKGVSGALFGAPERIARKPVSFGVSGMAGTIAGKEEDSGLFPEAKSEGGRMIGSAAELAGASVPVIEALQGAKALSGFNRVPSKAERMVRRFGKSRKESQKLQNVADTLVGDIKTARKRVGGDYESYLQKFGEEKVNPESLFSVIEKLPKDFVNELADAGVIRVFKNGRIGINPSLRNMKLFRDIVRGDVPTKYWKPKMVAPEINQMATEAYKEVGNVMKADRPELASIMDRYYNTMRAGNEIYPRLRSAEGFTRSKPLIGMFRRGGEGSYGQAIEQLAKENPDIMNTAVTASDVVKALLRKRAIENVARKFGMGALYATGGLAGLKMVNE